MSKSILLIHPDSAVRSAVRNLLASEDLRLTESLESGLSDLNSADAALIAWEALEPAAETLRWIRQKASARPARLIVLANRRDYPAAVRSLDYGADDCVGLPFEGDELAIRLNASLSRPPSARNRDQLVAGPIVLDRSIHRVLVNNEDVELAPTEFRLLAFLLENPGRVFSRNELLTRAWSNNVRAGHRTVDVHVRRLRQQLEPFDCAGMIQTVRGFGYRLRNDPFSASGSASEDDRRAAGDAVRHSGSGDAS